MNSEDRDILNQIALKLREIYPEARIWAFGSRARGTAEPDSDLDLCIVIKERTEVHVSQIRNLTWETGFENSIIITSVIYSEEEFEEGPGSFSPLVQVILEEGVAA